MLVLALTWGGTTYPWSDAHVVAPIVLAGVIFVIFAIYESYIDQHMAIYPISMFRNWNYSVASGMMVLYGALLFALMSYVPNFFQLVYGSSSMDSGLKMLPLVGGMIAFAITTGQIIARVGVYKPQAVLGSVFSLIGAAVMHALLYPTLRYSSFAGILFIIGAGTGFLTPVVNILVSTSVPKEFIAVATTGSAFLRSLGGVIGTTITATVLNNTYKNAIKSVPVDAFNFNHAAILKLPVKYQDIIFDGYTSAMRDVFAVSIAFAAALVVTAPLIRHVYLQKHNEKPPENAAAADGEEGQQVSASKIEPIALAEV